MDLPRAWIGIDIIGTELHGEIVVHSAGGRRVARRLGRVAPKLGFDGRGEALFRGVVSDVMAGPQIDHVRREAGIECRTHWVTAMDDTPVGLVVWLAPPPVAARPVYNTWMLDLQALSAAGGGDDLELYGTGRKRGEYRPLMKALQYMAPDDSPRFTTLIHGAEHEPEGALVGTYWSMRPADKWVHMWAATTNVGAPGRKRAVYGLTVQIPHRDLDTPLGNLVRYTGATLVMVDPLNQVVMNASGDLADMLLTDERRMARVLAQLDMPRLIDAAPTNDPVEQMISIEGDRFRAAIFASPTGPVRSGTLITVLLVPTTPRSAP
ncbi:hypothetical protein [Nocardia sp. NPDC051570]|uniref:hypothetical protein n=1 Tax=Nocardia sp. NPDC051570 TaxID=3364324 RepID=UPI0037AFA120